MAAPMIVHPADISIRADGSVAYQGETGKSVPAVTSRSLALSAAGNTGCLNTMCTGNGNSQCSNVLDCNTTGPVEG